MNKPEVFRLTSPEAIIAAYETVLSDERYHDTDHPLFRKGIEAGMEILAEAIASSISQRKLLESGSPQG